MASAPPTPLLSSDLSTLTDATFGVGLLDANDIARWFAAPFSFSESPPWGLRQRAGGPCGILAAVQGYILYRLLFGDDLTRAGELWGPGAPARAAARAAVNSRGPAALNAELEDRLAHGDYHAALVHALAFTLWQAASRSGGVAKVLEASVLPFSLETPAAAFRVHSFADFAALQAFVGSPAMAAAWASPSGVVQLLASVVLSRGVAAVVADMDEPAPLIARFGHCTQELLNLVLLGVAHSGAFDGEEDVGGMILRGVPCQPVVGYLSTVEALRYLRVGDFYKNPLVPIFVVGSESHMTVLFGGDPSAVEETPSAPLQRIFKKHEPSEGSGFVPLSSLPAILREAGLAGVADDPAALASLGKELDTMNAEIFTWAELWAAVSPMLMGGPAGAGASGAGAGVGASAAPGGGGGSDVVTEAALRFAFDSLCGGVDGTGFLQQHDLPALLMRLGVSHSRAASLLPQLKTHFPEGDVVLFDDLTRTAGYVGLLAGPTTTPPLPALVAHPAAASASASASMASGG